METVTNGYLKVEPIESEGFVVSQKETYEEIARVVARDEIRCSDIPLGSKVWFDSFMIKKYPKEGSFGKFDWFVHRDEIVQYAN